MNRFRVSRTRACLAAVLPLIFAVHSALVSGQTIDAAKLHREAIVVDGHVHIVTPVFHQGIDPWKVQESGLFDYARAKQGGLDVVVHTVYIEDPYNNYNYAVKQAVRLIETFYRVLDANADKMELALTSADVRRIVAKGKMAAILALEGGFDPEGDLDVLRLFHRLGVRMIQPVSHNTTNAFLDAGLGKKQWGGLTEHGREVIREMNRLGIMIDLSHASDAAKLQIIETSKAPVVGSHHGLRHFRDYPRNLSDEVLRAMAAKGGLMAMHSNAGFLSQAFVDWQKSQPSRQTTAGRHEVEGFTFFRKPYEDFGDYIHRLDAELHDRWIRPRHERGGTGYGIPWRERHRRVVDAGGPLPTTDDWADQVDYAVEIAGDSNVGIGLDLMSGPNLLDFDATSYPRLTEALVKKGYSAERIKKIMGENWLRALDAAKAP
jgi:membrane dipeptidase